MTKKILLFIYSLVISACLMTTIQAAVVGSQSVTVTIYYAYGDYGGGDIEVFYTPANALTGCDGAVWISGTQVGAKNLVSTLIAANSVNRPIMLYADNASLWSGSSAKVCKVFSMGLN
jgi:hypothetical protein